MPQILGQVDMIALFIMAVFWVSNVSGIAMAGTAAFSYLLLAGILFFIPCSLVTAQLGVMFPHEGSIYNWTHRAFRGRNPAFWSFFIGLCAWLPGVLSLVSAADVFVNCLQTLNPNWLVQAWQQGVVIILVTLFCGFISTRRTRTVQNTINVSAAVVAGVVVLIVLSALVWLVSGHSSATNFADGTGWAIHLTFDPNTTNIPVFGTVTLALLGATMPLNMAGEIKANGRGTIITRHLLWGSLFVLVGYFLLTFVVLAVGGQNAAFAAPNPIALLYSVAQTTLGSFGATVVMLGIMLFYIVVGVFENSISARLLMAAAIDRQLPVSLGKLNKFRVPANALTFQIVLAIVYTAVIFFGLPQLSFLGANSAELTTQAYTITAAGLLLIWAFSFMFPFIDAFLVYTRDRVAFTRQLVCPLPLLQISMFAGPLVCLAAIGSTLTASWIPTLIPNSQWWYIVLIVAGIVLVMAIMMSMFATGQASWETSFESPANTEERR